jgi:4-amino-4-deoxy-L-arabinose transferase-like glycosyltransferase
MGKTTLNKYIPYILLGLILLVASYYRLYQIRDHQVFLGDQGRDALVVKRMIVDHNFTLLGPTASVGGFFLGPIYYYMMALPLAISNLDPVGPAVMVALFSIATTFLCYQFGKKFFSTTTGLLAASVYAVSRLVVEYSRSSWNPNVLPFFSLLLIYAFTLIVSGKTTRRYSWFFIIGACLGIVIQLHYAAVALFFVAAVHAIVFFLRKRALKEQDFLKTTIRELSVLIAGFLLLFSPFILFELRHGHQNLNNIVQFVFSNRDQGFSGGYSYEFIIRDTVFRLFLRLVAGGYDLMPLTKPLPEVDGHLQDTAVVVTLVLWTTLIGTLLALYKLITRFVIYAKQRANSPSILGDVQGYVAKVYTNPTAMAWVVLLIWFIIGVSFWGFYKKSIYDYYYSFMYPLPILLFAFSLGTILHFKSRRFKTASPGNYTIAILKVFALSVLILVYVQNIKSINAIFPTRQVMRAEMVAKAVVAHKAPGPYNFALITEGNSDHAYRYFLEIYNERPKTLEEEVTPQLMVFCEMIECMPLGNPLWEVAGFGPATTVGQWQAIGWPMFRLEHLPETKYLEGKSAPKGI